VHIKSLHIIIMFIRVCTIVVKSCTDNLTLKLQTVITAHICWREDLQSKTFK